MLPDTAEIPSWATSALFGIAGAGAVAGALVKFLPTVRELWVRLNRVFASVDDKVSAKLALEESLRHMRRVRALKLVLHQWVTRKGAQRCLLLTANNGGDAWKGQGPLFCSNPAQVTGPAEPDTLHLWQNWQVDAWYASFLGKLLETFKYQRGYPLVVPQPGVEPNEDQPHGVLLNQYRDQGTCASLVLPFKWQEGSVLWYVSINFGRNPGDREITEAERADFVAAMRGIYDSPARCRALIIELQRTFDSIGPR